MSTRFKSLDVFRGATVALMILVNNPGTWSALYPPLAHAPWHGCTPTDLVFPFFLFAVGNALAFVMPGLLAGPAAAFWGKVVKRTLLIFAIGLFLNASPFVRWLDSPGLAPELVQRSWDSLRVMGVLQRIALCFGAAAVIVWLCGRYTRYPVVGPLWATAVLLVGYAVACKLWGAAGDPYSLKGFFGTAVDVALLGSAHLYKGEGIPFDPEGLVSTVPAVAQVLLGWWVGQRVLASRAAAGRLDMDLVARLFLWATVLLLLAYVWQLDMPLNKKIWSPSYVLHTTGLAMMGLALMVYVLDIRLKPRAAPNAGAVATSLHATVHATVHASASFFEVFGKNPLFVFVLAGLVPRVLALLRWQTGVNAEGLPVWTSPLPWAYQTVFAPLGAVFTTDPRLGSFLYACANLSIYWLLARWLDQRRIYIRV
jgi:predicted acyltransferase